MSACPVCQKPLGLLELARGICKECHEDTSARTQTLPVLKIQELLRTNALEQVRQGYLPEVQQDTLILPQGCRCHLCVPAHRQAMLHKKTPGTLLATESKFYFQPDNGKLVEVAWSRIRKMTQEPLGVRLEVAGGSGRGLYLVGEPEYVAAVLEACIRNASRACAPSSHVSAELQRSVRKMYGDRCAYCGATGKGVELTIDHIIPTSHGGATVLSNLQILCGVCNKKKGTRI